MGIKLNERGRQKIQNLVFREYGLRLESIWKRNTPVFTGRYKNSITARKTSGLGVIVGTNLDYAEKLETGGGEGEWPSREDIRRWARRKLGLQGDELEDATYLIQRKIYAEGVDENQVFMRSLKEFKQQIS